jgi:hypothetical protein
MTRTTTLALFMGAFMGFAASQLLSTAQALSPETLIKTESGVIVFVIEGQEKARIDQAGLSVNGRVRSVNLADTVVDAPADSHSAPERTR